jgi:dCMP deaminase
MISHWDTRFLDMARLVGSWSKDPRTKVGCVIVRPDHTVASVGFNGLASGMADESMLADRAVKHACVIHAEENALLFARESVKGYTAYVSLQPCARCATKLKHLGIARVVAYKNTCPHTAVTAEFELAERILALNLYLIYE